MIKNNSNMAASRLREAAPCRVRVLPRRFMAPGTYAAGLGALLWTLCEAVPGNASDFNPLVIAMVEASGTTYFEPVGRSIVIRSQPVRLYFRIRNTSDAAILVRASPENAYSIELKDQAGQIVMVKRKEGVGAKAADDERVYLPAGADKIVAIHISPDTWTGIPELKAGKESRYTARVLYRTGDDSTVYSEPYTLVFNILE